MSDEKKWEPLSVREGRQEPFKPVSGIPDFMRSSIQAWFCDLYYLLRHEAGVNIGTVNRAIERAIRVPNFRLETLANGDFRAGDDSILDAIDFLLWRIDCATFREHGYFENQSCGACLEAVFRQSGHEYRLDSDMRRLVKRVDETVWASYEHAMSAEDEASELIASAWAKQYSRDPDFAGAWEDANKAVLVALRPIASPKNSKATLSKLAREIREGEEKFEADLPGSELESSVLQFARALEIVGYPDNHHDGSTVDSRRSATAVLQAVTVVGWLRDGAFRRVHE
ncbi:hypothetical protein QEV68_04355 [Trueperella pyogenes]|uniref:hypothetical protein n=2 Tax=Trueperella pyogenes TaxID=1661 RepID=UPI0012D34E45|nr:hypothetical protein [Trueperella pyogenes]